MKKACLCVVVLLLAMAAAGNLRAQSQATGGSAAGAGAQDTKPAPAASKDAAGDQAAAGNNAATDANKPANPSGGDNTPQYDKRSFEVLTGVGAVLAGMEDTSYNVQNDALTATNVGRKRVELLLGGAFIMPWRLGGGWIERSYCGDDPKNGKNGQGKNGQGKNGAGDKNGQAKNGADNACRPGGDTDYKSYRPWETFLSIRFAPGSDQAINGFVIGGGYRVTKYFSLLIGYSVTPMDEPSPGFRIAASQIVANNPTISPYNRYNAADLLQNKPGAFDGFPLFVYNANGVTTQKLFLTSPTVTHYRSGTYFGVGIPLNLTALFKPSGK